MYKFIFKRAIDLLVSVTLLIILSPLFVLIYILLLSFNRNKPLFFQMRPGMNEKIFQIIKFKTMNDQIDLNGILLLDKDRITKIGKIIRKTSLDEIPQLLNVLRGDMSLIGPRPLLVEYLPLYNDFQKKRHILRPGITGWAQVNGRNAISWEKKFDYDVWYVENVSFLLDLKIVFLTIKKVFRREGVNSSESVTMDFFKGNNE